MFAREQVLLSCDKHLKSILELGEKRFFDIKVKTQLFVGDNSRKIGLNL